MNKRLIIQATQAAHGLDLPPNIGRVMEEAEHWNIGDAPAFHDLMQYMVFENLYFEATKSVLLYFKQLPNREACNVSMILKTTDLDFDWVKEQNITGALPSYFMFAYSTDLDMWHPASLKIGRGSPIVAMESGMPLSLNWLDTDPHPVTTPEMHASIQRALGMNLWFTLEALHASKLTVSARDGNQLNIGLTSHAAHTTTH